MIDLGSFGGDSTARGINDLGQIVGTAYAIGNQKPVATLWQSSTIIDLNTQIDPSSGWQLLDAFAINNFGQILVGATRSGASYSLLLTPIPEPSTLILLAIAGCHCWSLRVCRGWLAQRAQPIATTDWLEGGDQTCRPSEQFFKLLNSMDREDPNGNRWLNENVGCSFAEETLIGFSASRTAARTSALCSSLIRTPNLVGNCNN